MGIRLRPRQPPPPLQKRGGGASVPVAAAPAPVPARAVQPAAAMDPAFLQQQIMMEELRRSQLMTQQLMQQSKPKEAKPAVVQPGGPRSAMVGMVHAAKQEFEALKEVRGLGEELFARPNPGWVDFANSQMGGVFGNALGQIGVSVTNHFLEERRLAKQERALEKQNQILARMEKLQGQGAHIPPEMRQQFQQGAGVGTDDGSQAAAGSVQQPQGYAGYAQQQQAAGYANPAAPAQPQMDPRQLAEMISPHLQLSADPSEAARMQQLEGVVQQQSAALQQQQQVNSALLEEMKAMRAELARAASPRPAPRPVTPPPTISSSENVTCPECDAILAPDVDACPKCGYDLTGWGEEVGQDAARPPG